MSLLNASLVACIERIVSVPPIGYTCLPMANDEFEWPRTGIHFKLRKQGISASVSPWFGVYDTAIGPIIYIGFEGITAWRCAEGHYFKRPYVDVLRKEFCFALKDEQLYAFQNASNAVVRETILRDFFQEVLGCISSRAFGQAEIPKYSNIS